MLASLFSTAISFMTWNWFNAFWPMSHWVTDCFEAFLC